MTNGMQRMVVAGLLATLAGIAGAQQSEGMLQKRLDTPVTVKIEDRPIGEVFWKLTREANVRFVVSDDTLAALPYGEQTHMDVELRDISLRAALPQLLRPHGLAWRIKDTTVEIVPSDALYRMARRATYDELVLLGKLLTADIQPDAEASPVDMLRKATGDGELTLLLPEASLLDIKAARQRADQILPAPAADWLDMLCGRDCTWYLSGRLLTVVPRTEQIRRQLHRKVSLRYQNTQLVKVLLDLARHGRFKLTLSPGALNALPGDVRNDFTLMIDDATIAQAMEVISGATGLEFSVTDEGVDARPALTLQTAPATAADDSDTRRRRAGVILRTSFIGSDGLERDVLVPLFDLPDDLVQQLERQRANAIIEMQKHWVAPEISQDDAQPDAADNELVPASLKPDLDTIRAKAADDSTQPSPQTPPTP